MRVSVICGSIRESLDDMRDLEQDLTKAGIVVLFPVPLEVEDHDPFADAMHLARIGFAVEHDGMILAFTKQDGTFGVSTAREVEFARLIGGRVSICLSRSLTEEGLRTYLQSEARGEMVNVPEWIAERPDLRAVLEEFYTPYEGEVNVESN